MLLIWMIYSLSMATVRTDAMAAWGSNYQASGVETEEALYDLSDWTRDDPGESGGRRLSDRKDLR